MSFRNWLLMQKIEDNILKDFQNDVKADKYFNPASYIELVVYLKNHAACSEAKRTGKTLFRYYENIR